MFENAIGLKKRIRDGEQIVGTTLPLDATRERFQQVMDSGPYDFVSADSQHSAFNEERLEEFCGIAEELDVFAQFRIKHTRNAYLIGNYLDLGPCGAEVPQTETDETAQSRPWTHSTIRRRGSGVSADVRGAGRLRSPIPSNTRTGGTPTGCCGCKSSP